jgi:hypothetical protein
MTTPTVNTLMAKILADIANSEALGVPKKYPFMSEIGDGDRFMDMMTAVDKPLGKCTGAEVAMIGLAYTKIGEMQEKS